MTYRQKLFGQMGHLQNLRINLCSNWLKTCLFSTRKKLFVSFLQLPLVKVSRRNVMSMKKDRPIVQDSESFAELARNLVPSTKVKHFSGEEIANYKKTSPFWTQFLRMVYFICMLRQRMDQRHNFGEILHTTRCERKQI